MSSVWNYFTRNETKDAAFCKECIEPTKIKTNGGSTSGLHSHLRSQHQINLSKRKVETASKEQLNNNSKTKKPTKITHYLNKTDDDSFPALASRMVAKDGLPFNKFCTSNDLRNLLTAKGYTNLPKSPNTVKHLVMKYAEKIRQLVISELSHRVQQGENFSLSFDEWTSIRNRRYMNVNIHSQKEFWNLGLSRVYGNMPAEKCVELLKKKLADFGVDIKNIVSITTDGAAVMKKVGKLININQQLCLAHGIHLAVTKVLYKNPGSQISNSETDETFFE